jgi:hypothetical protein
MEKLKLLDIQSYPLECKQQIEDKINEIVEEKNQQDEINKKLVENIDKILSFLNL